MGSSWTQNFYHAAYGTKLRTPWITPEIEERFHPFLGGIAKDLNCAPIAINGMAEHVHVLVRFPSDLAVADLLRHLKYAPRSGFTRHSRHCATSVGRRAMAGSP